MADEIIIRPARPEEAGAIVSVIRQSFAPEHLRLFIYHSAGIEAYVHRQIALDGRHGDGVYTVACAGTRVVGCVEMYRLPACLHLNYIAIDAAYRAAGLGKRLLRAATAHACHPAHQQMTLDVFSDSGFLREWYERLGFAPQHLTHWWDCPILPGGNGAAACVREYAQAQLVQQAYGFSRFTVATTTGEYTVGCMGREWFRVGRAEALCDLDLHVVLKALDPTRRMLALLHEDECLRLPAQATRLVTTVREVVPLTVLCGHLGLLPVPAE